MKKLDTVIPAVLNRIKYAPDGKCNTANLMSGFERLDEITKGFESSDLVVVGARPGVGKSTFLSQLMLNMSRGNGIACMFFSLDMSVNAFVTRLISSLAEVEITKVRGNELTNNEQKEVERAASLLNGLPLYVDDQPTTIEELCQKAEEAVVEHGVRAIFIDYLQLLSVGRDHENRYQDMAYCTRKLKALAKQLNVVVVVASQLNRNVEYRSDIYRRPEIYDLRDSGTICEDANLVLLLERPELVLRGNTDADNRIIRGLLEVVIAKNNNGPVDELSLYFDGAKCKVENWRTDVCDGLGIPCS